MKKEDEIRVLTVDDSQVFRRSVELLLDSTPGYRAVGSFESGLEIEKMLKHLEPDVVLMDIDMPSINGIDVVKKIRAVDTSIPILMLTGFEDEDKVFASICAGASGYLLKNTEPRDLLAHISEVGNGGAPMTPSIARKVLTMMKQNNSAAPRSKEIELSKREREVLQLLVNGLSYKMIATELGISYETVHSHIKKIYKALHVNSATEAVARSLRDGLLLLVALLQLV